ncbi:MAG: hypothetical protein ABR865_15355 [Terracidiphilus sp.]|jgi:hypothetical protein
MAYERMADVRQKVKWAEHHFKGVKTSIKDFMGTRPYEIKVESDADGNPEVHVIKAEPIPASIRLGCGDVIQNLRSALDYLACALVRAIGCIPSGQTEFPVFDGAILNSKDKASFQRKTKGMRQEAIDQILSMHPYQGGDNLLWRLHRLNRIDKHNMLVTTLGNITAINGLPPIEDLWDGNRWGWVSGVPLGLKAGDKFCPQLPGVTVDKTTGFFAEIVLNEPNVAEGYPVVLALTQFHRHVFDVCGALSWALR